MFLLNDRLSKFVCDTSSTVLSSNDNIICVSSSYDNVSNFLRWLKDNVNWILILVTKSTIGYGYVLTLDGGALSWKYVKNLFCHDLLCKHKLFLFTMHPDNQIIIFKVPSKNVNEIDI